MGEVLETRRRYLPQTLVVETTFRTHAGEVKVLDFMPQRKGNSRLVRIVRGVRGKVRMRLELALRFDYGRTVPWVTQTKHELRAVAGPDMVVLHTAVKTRGEGLTTVSEFDVKQGQSVPFTLTYCSSMGEGPQPIDVEAALAETVGFWNDWMAVSNYRGPYKEIVDRSLITLKALTYKPSGGIVAAPTTSLPAWIGGKRGPRRQFTHSKVMAWVALDRAIKHHEQFDGAGDVKRWKKNREMIREEVLARGFSTKLNSFTQSYGSDDLDASCLRIVLVGFLPPDDPRIVGTVEAIERKLVRGGLVERYSGGSAADGLAGQEGTFLACSFWLISTLHLVGREDDARVMFDRLLLLANDVGLLSEEYDPKAQRMLGNFPQALSHIALVHSAFTLAGLWRPDGFRRTDR